jgi:hypothetical protein
MSFEQQLQRNLFSQNVERTAIDKLLSRKEVERVKELIKQEKLNRSDLLELLYLCLSTESKLLNLGSWDRYVILKFFVWIREFIKIAELMYDLKEFLESKENLCSTCKGYIDGKKSKKSDTACYCYMHGKIPEPSIELSDRTKQILKNNELLIEHNAKFLIDLYFNIVRTTLSLGGTGFMELLKNKFEIFYPNNPMGTQEAEKPKLWGFGKQKNN